MPNIEDEDKEVEAVLLDITIDDGPFTQEEYHRDKQSLTEGKASGEDGITAETLKRCNLDEIVLDFCKEAHMKHFKLDQWSILNIVHTPQSGELSDAGHYRGISLSSVVTKLYNRLILNRIRPVTDPHLRVNQYGFRQSKITVAQVRRFLKSDVGVTDTEELTACMKERAEW